MTLHAQACVSTVGRGGKVKLAVPFFISLSKTFIGERGLDHPPT